jgi:hypothetical protein
MKQSIIQVKEQDSGKERERKLNDLAKLFDNRITVLENLIRKQGEEIEEINEGDDYDSRITALEEGLGGNMPIVPVKDFYLEVAKGNIAGHYYVNKFGNTSNADANVITDVWDAPAQPVWLAPTAARIHEILSTSDEDSDVGGTIPQGTGARTLRIFGLQDWDTAETSEDVIMDGTDGVNTVNSYVIIHRMIVLTGGTALPNVGTITAVAAVDGTVTARISPNRGQTFMAIYGIPSTQKGYMSSFSASIARSSPVSAEAGVIVFKSTDIENDTTAFTFKHTTAVNEDGTVATQHFFSPPKMFEGPCIVKVAFTAGANDTFGDASFDMVVVDN